MASILEVIITSVIFTLAAFGIFSTISMLSPESSRSAQKLKAAHIGKGYLENLRKSIDAVTWDTGNLAVQTYGPYIVDGYTIDYIVTDVAGLELRQVDMTVSWTN